MSVEIEGLKDIINLLEYSNPLKNVIISSTNIVENKLIELTKKIEELKKENKTLKEKVDYDSKEKNITEQSQPDIPIYKTIDNLKLTKKRPRIETYKTPEPTKRKSSVCSQCKYKGHNSQTCIIKLQGITSIKKILNFISKKDNMLNFLNNLEKETYTIIMDFYKKIETLHNSYDYGNKYNKDCQIIIDLLYSIKQTALEKNTGLSPVDLDFEDFTDME